MKITVVMTAYNLEGWIDKAITSVLNSTYKDIELVIVEDCSTDKTKAIVNKFAKTDKRIKVINNLVNLGAGMSRRVGIEASTGDFIITIDGDDEITSDFIEALVNKQKETNADIVSGGITIRRFDEDYIETKSWGNRVSEGIQKFEDYNKQRIIILNNKLVRKTMYATEEERLKNTSNKVVYSDRRYCEDTPVIIPLLYYANKVAYCNNTGYIYNMRDASLTHKVDKFQEYVFKALCVRDIIKFFEDKPEYKHLMPVGEFIQDMQIAKQNATTEGLQKYVKEWCELTFDLLNYIK